MGCYEIVWLLCVTVAVFLAKESEVVLSYMDRNNRGVVFRPLSLIKRANICISPGEDLFLKEKIVPTSLFPLKSLILGYSSHGAQNNGVRFTQVRVLMQQPFFIAMTMR